MKAISSALKDRMATGCACLVRLWAITLVSGTTYYFCDGTDDVWFDSIRYYAFPGIEISAIRDSVDSGYGDADVTLIMTDSEIDEATVRYRRLVNATFTIIAVDYEMPEAGSMFLYGGTLGDFKIDGQVAKLNAKGGKLGGVYVGERYSEKCRNIFGDRRCGINVKEKEMPFEVTGIYISANNSFYTSLIVPGSDNENPLLGNVQVELVDTPGTGHYTVPNCTQLTIKASGGGGAASAVTSVVNGRQIVGPGGAGGDTSILDLVAHGGQGGGVGAFGADGAGTGGTSNGSGDGGIGGGRHLNNSPHVIDSFNYVTTTGGNGGSCQKSYSVGIGSGFDLQVGQVISYTVGQSGAVSSAVNPEGGASYQGESGFIKFFSRSEVDGVDNAAGFGTILWTSGNNKGLVSDILKIRDKGLFTIGSGATTQVQIGDQGILKPGCSRYRSMCIAYNNMEHYRGEPDVPNFLGEVPKNAVPDPITSPAYRVDMQQGI